jgi:molybdenum cofactor biosynthesis protein B
VPNCRCKPYNPLVSAVTVGCRPEICTGTILRLSQVKGVPMSQVVREHHATSPTRLGCAVITISDSRTLETDTGGQTISELLTAAGHAVLAREIVPDEPVGLERLLTLLAARDGVDAILLTGGTGLSSRDQTFETVSRLLSKPLPGYGELFRMLSYQEIGAAAMLSRATAGLIGRRVVLTMPGSPAGVRLAMEKLILPELAHLVREARR